MTDATPTKRFEIHGICLVKNEDDVIAQSLAFASRFCDRIYVIDNGSTDETWNLVTALAKENPVIVPFEQTFEPYGDWLRANVFNALHDQLSEHDWWFFLDADEFVAEDPRPVIDAAVEEGADLIHAWQIQFYFTEKDVQSWELGKEDRSRPIVERRRYYSINWQEPRLFRNNPHQAWNGRASIKLPEYLNRGARRRLRNRHFQFRDPEQITKRLSLRYGHALFPHVTSAAWRDTIRDSRKLVYHADDAPWRFTASGVVFFYRRNLYHRFRGLQGGVMRRIRRLFTRK